MDALRYRRDRMSSQGEGEAQVKRRFRLTRSGDFQRVRRFGKSYAHPLIVLFVFAKHIVPEGYPCGTASEAPGVRVGVAAGRTVGNAVQRNRAKRLLRAAMQNLYPKIVPGFDLVLIARQPLPSAALTQTQEALFTLLSRAGLLSPTHDG
ncbi:MAG: ribonuclease P protein component [Anaerolineae bacterium CG_4_9_14_0_8_um_filter_58_9]|nr:MAG: ribonuclease P protein component [Anaerolineae bacterium CG_4_8_14_3_um_filter_59_70]PJH74472.1 MAG: ribonuclease P protein component [Anaerolineae bacterium CG_4_9_14_0_8_um_filter_58_9]